MLAAAIVARLRSRTDCCCPPAFAQSAPPAGVWTAKKPLPGTPRNEVALAAVGGKLYVVGGGIQGNAVPVVDEYDPATDTWRPRAPMPKGLDHHRHRGARRQDRHRRRLHRLGASRRGRRRVRVRSRGRLLARAGSAQEPARGSVGATVLDGKIHAVGGRGVDNTFTVGTHEVYDPATNTWTERAPMPTARDHLALVAIDGKLHAIGGRVTNPQSRVGDARRLRPEDQCLVARPAAADRALGPRLRELPGHDRGARRRAAAQHVPGERGVRSEVDAPGARWPRCRPAAMAPAPR